MDEKTFLRDLKYNNWHRTLPSFCKAWNIDFVEVRNGEISGFFEIAETAYPLEKVNLKFKQGHKFLLEKLSSYTNIPAFIVFHNKELTHFKVFDLQKKTDVILPAEEYRQWLVNI